jgi:hypothetical protein
MRKHFILLLTFFVILACSEDNRIRKTEVFEIREIGELSTTEFIYSKVLKIDDSGEWYKLGDWKILISCKAKVKAGIDLTGIKKEDIVTKGTTIKVFLPKPKVTSFNMDPNSIKTEMADVSGMRFSFSQEEKNRILQMGEKSIRNGLTETGIYSEARRNVISFITEFYQQMGFEKVIVVIRGDDEK